MSGKSLPWLPWFHRDFLAATQGWTLLERGAYFMLLNAQWEMGALPNDHRRLAGIIGAQLDELKGVWLVVGAKFETTPTGLVNRRLEQHRATQTERSNKARQSALLRWSKNANADADAHANAYANGGAKEHAQSMLPEPEPEPKPKEEEISVTNAAAAHHDDRRLKLTMSAPTNQNGLDRALQERIVAAYHERLPLLPAVKVWNGRRSKKLGARIRETLDRGKPGDTVDWWQQFFEAVAASDFLCGRKTEWRVPGLEWLLEQRNFEKVIEGAYTNRRDGAR